MRRRFSYYFRSKPLGFRQPRALSSRNLSGWRRNPPISTILHRASDSRRPPKRCEFVNSRGIRCGEPTRERKPFCPEHVEEHPYIQQLIAKIEDKEREEERVAEFGEFEIAEDSLTSQEILAQLSIYGARTVERLARDMNLGIPIIEHYVSKLAREGKIELGSSSRGKTVVKPVKSRLRRWNPHRRYNPYGSFSRRYNPYRNYY